MLRVRLTVLRASALLVTLAACHKAKPASTSADPVLASSGSDALENARRDSIARANAERDAAARRDSIAAAEARGATELDAARITVTTTIYFAYNRAELSADAITLLDAKAKHLRAWGDMRVRIEGHTDERGSAEYNMALGQQRAAAARRYLVNLGIDEGRIDVVSFGEERPVCEESAESCWGRNRRDEFLIVTS